MRNVLKLELVDEYRIREELREEIRGLLAGSFPDEPFTRSRTYLKQFPARRLLAHENETLVGHLGLEHRAIGTDRGARQIMGVVDLCVASARQGQGIASRMLAWVESLAREAGVPFLVLFAHDRRVYEACGFSHASNVLRWAKIDEHRILGVGEEPLEELMVKPVGDEPWPRGTIDLLGHQF